MSATDAPPHPATVRIPYIIDLPHEGFNPSITRWRGKLLIAWRKGWFSARMWIGELSEDHRLLWGREMDFSGLWRLTEEDWLEDPRLVLAGDKLLVVFTYVKHGNIFMALATLNDSLEVEDCRIMDTANRRWEKNWQFFEHDRVLRAVYYPNPHTVGWRAGNEFRIPAADGARLDWAWGEVRGGTPPIRVGDEYFSFFHSSLNCHYVAGFYAFEAKPPFRVTRWPSQPCMIAAKDQWRGGHAVVFPGGAILENGKWTVSFGWQDAFCCLAWFDHDELLATLETRTLPPAKVTLPGQTGYYKPFTMEPPRSAEPVRPPCVKLVTAFVDLNRVEPRPPGKDAASYLEHARNLFAANPPLVVWVDCDAELRAKIRRLAAPHSNITVKEFRVEETETWQAVSNAGPLNLPRQRDGVKDTTAYFAAILLKSELVARSICEGDIPGEMNAGWIDFRINHLPGMAIAIPEWLPKMISAPSDRIRIPGIVPPEKFTGIDYMEGVHWYFCGGLFSGPQMLLLKFAGEVLRQLRLMLLRGEITWEVNLWALIYTRHPQWFSWYAADFMQAPSCSMSLPEANESSKNEPEKPQTANHTTTPDSNTERLYGKCLYGLGNRITTICATYACAKIRGLEPVFTWGIDWDCQCSFDDLFEPHPGIREVGSIPEGAEVFSECCYYPEAMPHHLHAARIDILNEAYWDAWRECARGFKLKPHLSIPAVSGFMAIHARENDQVRAEGSKVILSNMPAFVACDSPSLKARIHSMMPSSWSLPANIVDLDYGEGSRKLKQMQDAARDMVMLTQAAAILTIGRDSTFRNLAVIGYGVPCFKFYHDLNP